MIYFDTVSAYCKFNQKDSTHPYIACIDLSTVPPRKGQKMFYGIYAIFLKQVSCGDLTYGKQVYDYQEGTLVFVGPGQVIDVQDKVSFYQPNGHVLVFHPDLFLGRRSGQSLKNYRFFNYGTSAALHMSEDEKEAVEFLFKQIGQELNSPVEDQTTDLIKTQVQLLLQYCERFYERQFNTRKQATQGILERMESLLHDYLNSDKPETPTVANCAFRLSVSPNYLGDLIKKETGRSALDLIQDFLVQEAKSRLSDPRVTVAQVAYSMGFRYPQHFIRLFKKKVGMTPKDFRLPKAK
jgi:AraC family transcriptional activator of pobA